MSTEKPYKKLLGNRVFLKLDLPSYSLEMAESAKQTLITEAAQKLNKAEVYDIGDTVAALGIINLGDTVCVSKQGITRGEFLNLSKDLTVVMVSPLDIIHIW